MATKAKDVAVKKEKKVTTSSQTQRQGNPKPAASQLGPNHKVKPSAGASPSGRQTPNYLKPTFSSKPETTTKRTTRKSTNAIDEDTAAQKARVLRRRSFDRPPPLSRQDSSGAKETTASRLRTASSLKSTGIHSNRPASSLHKPGASRSVNPAYKSQPPGAAPRTLRRSSSSSSDKNGISSAPVSSTSSPTKADNPAPASDPDNKPDETIEEGLLCSDTELQVHGDELETSNKEHLEAADTEVGDTKDEHVEAWEVPTASEVQNRPRDVLVEEAKGDLAHETEEEEVENLPGNEENQGEEERSKCQPEGSSPDETRVSDEDIGEENVADGSDLVSSKQPAAEEAKQEEEGARDEATGGEVDPSKEEKGGQEVGDQVAKEAEVPPQQQASVAAPLQKRPVGQGKKEAPSAYNDVIEETKNKLLEARKNKVKALVGAFETVIDYESAGSK